MLLTESLAALFRRDLAALRREVDAYPDETTPWQAIPGLTNSGGSLVRHLCGNLQHFIGTVLGATGYLRDRDNEFNGPPCSRATLLADIEATEVAVTATLQALTPEQMAAIYPQPLGGVEFESGDFLTHLAVHLGYHLGQVDYHRRAATGDSTSVAGNSLIGLASARKV